jgi:hypothetical protein
MLRHNQPDFHERVRALPIRIEQVSGFDQNGQRGVWKKYVHRSGRTLTRFVPIIDRTDSGTHGIAFAEDEAPNGYAPDADEGAANSSASSDYCEDNDEVLGFFAGDCATEEEVEDGVVLMLAWEVEWTDISADLEAESASHCAEIESDVEGGGPDWTFDEEEFCLPYAPTYAVGAADIGANSPAADFVLESDSEACARGELQYGQRNCVIEGIYAAAAAVITVAHWVETMAWISNITVVSRVTLVLFSAKLAMYIGLAATTLAMIYVYEECRIPH